MQQGAVHEIDRILIHQARKFITAANIHYVKTWIFCYETSAPNSPRRERYETLLRGFIASNSLLRATRLQIERDGLRIA
jgi:hypothetical protein